MKLTTIIMILLVPSSSTLVVSSPRNSLESTISRRASNISGYCTPCPSIGDRPAFFAHYRALERARKDDLAISPGASLPSPPSYGPRNDNTTDNTTDFAGLPDWSPSIETIVTAIFRALLTVLTLFNVNITWRIHGKSPYLKTPIDPCLTSVHSTQCRPPSPRPPRSYPYSQETMAGMKSTKPILVSWIKHTYNAAFEDVLPNEASDINTLSPRSRSACSSISL